ncbi:MAG: MATE family efflux transporter [Bacteroides sp.]|nr:MATE family efflux transporter [Bacteroides sp.]MCM1084951.1 MATE family efflux transporter [Bacteroides sp.]
MTSAHSPSDSITYRRILGIAFPIILSTLAQNVIAIADTIFLGNLGEVELGAAALAAVFYQVLVMVVFGFGVGAQIVMARRVGQGQHSEVGRIFQHTLWFTLFCSVLCWGAFQGWGENLLPHLVKTPAILQAVHGYLEIRIYGVPFAFAIAAFNAFYVGIARTQTISVATIIMGTVNVVLDYGLVFGKLGLPQMGMGGAALASVIAEAVGVACYVALTAFSKYRKTYRPFGRFALSFKLIGNLIGVSYPVMIQYFLSFANYFLFFLFIESLGQRALAISNITRSMYTLFLLPIWGFASTTATLTSYLCGQNRAGEIRLVVRKACLSALASVSFIVLLFVPFHNAILGIFTQDNQLATESLRPCAVAIAATYIMIFAQIIFNTILGRGNTKAGFFIELINMVVYFLYGWSVIYVGQCSVEVAFGAEIAYTAGLLLISATYILWQRKTGHRQIRNF